MAVGEDVSGAGRAAAVGAGAAFDGAAGGEEGLVAGSGAAFADGAGAGAGSPPGVVVVGSLVAEELPRARSRTLRASAGASRSRTSSVSLAPRSIQKRTAALSA